MIPAAFDYVRAESADDAIALLGEHGDDAKLLAGGMSLLPLMKLRLATPTVLVDVGRVRDLSYVRDAGDHVAIGALTRHRDVETDDLLARECGGGPRGRRAGRRQPGSTPRHDRRVGRARRPRLRSAGRVARARRHVRRRRARVATREIPATEFFQGFLETALAPDELLTEIRVPKTGANGFAFEKFNRRAQDFAIVGVVAARANGATHVGLINMGSTPLRATAVEQALAQGASAADAAARGGRGHRADRRPERVGRVPRAPRPRARAPRARGDLSRRRGRPRRGPGRALRRRRAQAARRRCAAARSLAYAVDAAVASGLTPVVVVVSDERVEAAFGAIHGVAIARNDAPERGIASSLQAALRCARGRRRRSTAWSSDWPTSRWSAPTRTAGSTARTTTAPASRSRRTPVCAAIRCSIAREHWAEALALDGDEGARVLLRRHGAVEVPCDGTGEPTDVDTPDALAAVASRLEQPERPLET